MIFLLKMSIEVKTHTALHVLKGAVFKVLGAKWTAGTYVKGPHGRLTVQLARKPTEDEIDRIEYETNRKIKEDAPVQELEVERAEAELVWGDSIYDLFPLPASVKRVKILQISGWNVNACKELHCRTTGEIGSIKILETRYRPSRNLLEISFDVSFC